MNYVLNQPKLARKFTESLLRLDDIRSTSAFFNKTWEATTPILRGKRQRIFDKNNNNIEDCH